MEEDVLAPGEDGRRRDAGAVVRDFKEFIKTHFTHDRRETDEPLVYRCAAGGSLCSRLTPGAGCKGWGVFQLLSGTWRRVQTRGLGGPSAAV